MVSKQKINDTSKFKGLYVKTARKNIKAAQKYLLKLQKDPTNKKAIGEVFRLAHSVKGEAAAMGYKKDSSASRRIEYLFRDIQEGKRKVTGSLIKNVSASFDKLAASIDKVAI